MNKAKVIKTGEVLDVKLMSYNVNIDINFDDGKYNIICDKNPISVVLSDNKPYYQNDIIFGIDSIRENSIKNILSDGDE